MSIFDSKKKKNKPDDEGFFDYDAYISGKEEKSSSDILKETDPDKLIEAIAEKKARDKISEDMKLPEEKKAEEIKEETSETKKEEVKPEKKVEEVKTDDVKSEEKSSETKEEKSKKKLFQKSEKADKKQDKKPVEEKVETPKEITPEIEEQPVPEMIEGAPEKESVSVSIEDIKSSFMNMPSPEKKEEEKSKKTQRKPFKLEKSEKTEKKQKEEKPKKVHSEKKKADDPFDELKIVFDSALDEDVSEIEEFSSEPETTSEHIIRKSFKRNSYLAIGVVVSVLALIGFVSSVLFVKGIAEGIANNTKQKEEFKSIVYPLVIIDSPEFDDITQLSPDSVLNAAIWDILLHGDISKYEESYENITIPQADVELHATKLFGKNLTFKHRDVGDVSLTFYYNSETKSYTVPVTPEFFSYSPVIRNVAKNGDTYDVAVGYLAPAPSWVEERDKELATLPEKYVIVKLKKEDNGYIVVSCKETDEYETRVNVF